MANNELCVIYSTSYWYSNSNYSASDALDAANRRWQMAENFRRLLDRLFPPSLEPNPLPILSRAVNAVRFFRRMFKPRWRRGRWKAKT